jgi:HTH-type transcriptional regulator/antitoxin HipB
VETIVRTPQQLAQTLRAQRARKQLTQVLAGKNVGLLPKTISALEQKPEKSSVESLFRLLSALGLELVIRDKPTVSQETSGPEW